MHSHCRFPILKQFLFVGFLDALVRKNPHSFQTNLGFGRGLFCIWVSQFAAFQLPSFQLRCEALCALVLENPGRSLVLEHLLLVMLFKTMVIGKDSQAGLRDAGENSISQVIASLSGKHANRSKNESAGRCIFKHRKFSTIFCSHPKPVTNTVICH